MGKSLNSPTISCRFCSRSADVAPKISFLGFRRFKCLNCGRVNQYRLTVTLLVVYCFLAYVFAHAAIGAASWRESWLSWVFLIGIGAALVKHFRLPKL
jgi:phage FluMu protein Com